MSESSRLSYGVAVTAVAVAVLVRWGLNPLLGEVAPFVTFFVAVVFASWYGGWGPAVVALAFCAAASPLFLDFTIPWNARHAANLLNLAMFVVVGLGCATLGGSMRTSESAARRAADELRSQRDRLRVTLASIGDGVIVTDNQGRVKLLNAVAEQLTGWRSDEALDRPLEDVFRIVDEGTRAPLGNVVERALREGVIVGLANHTLLIDRQGRERPIDDSVAPVQSGGQVLGAVLVFRDVAERRAAQRALQESEERFRLLSEMLPQAIWTCLPDGSAEYYNDRWQEFTGQDLNDAVGDGWLQALHPDDRKQAWECWQRAVATGDDYQAEYRFRGPDGIYRWFLARGKPQRDSQGQIVRWFGTSTNIDEQKRLQEVSRIDEERLRLALDAGQMGVWDWDIRTNAVRWDGRLEEIHGIPPGSFGGDFEHFRRLIYPGDRAKVEGAVMRAVEQRSDYEIEFRNLRPDGSVRWIAGRGKVFCDAQGEPQRMIGVGLDVTQRRRREEALQFLAESSAALASLLDSTSTMVSLARLACPLFADWCEIALLNADGELKSVARIHSDPRRQPLLEKLVQRYGPAHRGGGEVRQVLQSAAPLFQPRLDESDWVRLAIDAEHLQMLGDLQMRSRLCVPMQVRNQPLGTITFVLGESGRAYSQADLELAEDLAHRAAIALDNARLYAEVQDNNRRKDVFLATLAHELRNPLAPLRSAADMMEAGRLDQQQQELAREVIRRQVDYMTQLVDDLLDLARLTHGQVELRKQPANLADIVERAVEATRWIIDQRRHRLQIDLPDDIQLLVDPLRMEQILANLLHNAAKYTEPEGEIRLTAARAAGQVEIVVRDTGIGISPEMLPDLFQMFVQAKEHRGRSQGGLGIGLNLVRQLVELHGGTVAARSPGPGRGSEFIVRLPARMPPEDSSAPSASVPAIESPEPSADHAESPMHRNHATAEAPRRDPATGPLPQVAADASSQPASSGGRGTGRKILVVDDNVDAARTLAALLRVLGHQVESVHDGPAALEAVAGSDFQAIFLDIGLPTLDGYEVARRIRRSAGRQPYLIALTGWGQDEDRRRSREAGFDEHLTKPVALATLQPLLARVS